MDSEHHGKPPAPRVLNKYKMLPGEEAVYCGRGSPYGNPYPMGPDCTREQSIALFKEYVDQVPYLGTMIQKNLKGKNLMCFCKPKDCHCDDILEIANYE